jgi:hypothetical protein
MSRIVVVAAALIALLLPSAAHAGEPFTVGTGRAPHLVVDADGTAHVTWSDVLAKKVKYCQVPRGQRACAAPGATLDMPGASEPGLPFLVRGPGATLYIAMAHYVSEDTLLWTSNDNGATWTTGPAKIYDAPNTTDSSDPVLGPQAGEITFASFNPSKLIWSARIDGSEAAKKSSDAADLPGGGGYDLGVGLRDDGGLIAAGNDLNRAYWWRMEPGAEPSATPSWVGPNDLGVMDTTRVAGGPTGAYILGTAGEAGSGQRMEIRRYAGGLMGPPIVLAEETGYINDVTVAPSGVVGAIWRRNGDPDDLRFARSKDGAGPYAVTVIAQEEGTLANMDVGLGNDGEGFAVYEGREAGNPQALEIRLADTTPLDATPVAGGGGAAGGDTPLPATRRVSARVPGATLRLGVPRQCIPPGRPFVATLTWARQKRKRNLFVKVSRTDFFIGARRVKTDRTAPFRQTLTIPRPQAGQTYRLRARATIKVRRGKAPKKSVFATLRVCS